MSPKNNQNMSIKLSFVNMFSLHVDWIDISSPQSLFMSIKEGFLNMEWQAEQAYNHLPPLPLDSALAELAETLPILKACIPARAALAELKQAGELLPNQGLLINLLPLLEAQGSSEIENIVTTTDKLFQYAQEDSQADPMTKARSSVHQINIHDL